LSKALDRASIYIQQGRNEEALRELAMAGAEDPDNYHVPGLTSLALSRLKKPKEAVKQAERSILMAPDVAWPHRIHAIALMSNGNAKLAENAIRTALQIEPDNPSHHHLLGRILAVGSRWKAALESANRALELDPEHEDALMLRAEALSNMGQGSEARYAARQAVEQNPSSADAHASLGWASLRNGDHKAAEKYFQESLRLDPKDEEAQTGLIESLRASFPPYRFLLKVTFLIGRLPREAQSFIFIGLYFAFRVGVEAMRAQPNLVPILAPVVVVLGVFYFLRWFGDLVADSILLFHPLGRLALGPQRRLEALVFTFFLSLIPLFSVVTVLTPLNLWATTSVSALSLFILGMVHKLETNPKKHRRAYLWAAAFATTLTVGTFIADFIRLTKRA